MPFNKERKHEYYLRNIDFFKKVGRERYYRTKDEPNSVYLRYNYNAKRRNLAFELTLEDFMKMWNKPCFYCNTTIKTIGIDRLDNKKGYVKGNVAPCCKICNYMKRTSSFNNFIKKVAEIHNNINSKSLS